MILSRKFVLKTASPENHHSMKTKFNKLRKLKNSCALSVPCKNRDKRSIAYEKHIMFIEFLIGNFNKSGGKNDKGVDHRAQ